MPSATSIASYESRVSRVKSVAACEDLTQTETIIAAVDAMDIVPATKKAYYTALYHHTKLLPYKERFGAINDSLREAAAKQQKTPKEEALWLPWPEIQAKGLKALTDPTLGIEERLLMGLYTQLPPARLDYCDVFVVTYPVTDLSGCVIELGANVVHIVDHKTSKSVGTIKHALPPCLVSVLYQFLGTEPSKVLFKGLTPNALGKRIHTLFQAHAGKAVHVNILRHSYITEQSKGDRFLAERLETAASMGHSVAMDELYRRR
jgi:hypothetical protein